SWECKTKQVPTPTPFEKVYKVSYEFKSNTSDKELPQEVKKLLPQEEKYYNIQKVKPKDVTPKEVKVGNDTWTFKGFDKNEIMLKDGENKFIGSWECKTKQVPTPDPVPTPNPTPNPGLDEDEDENNNNDKKQNDKEQKLPQTNIAGNSLLTLTLSAIAVVFSKKKRK
ncbi:LPXTG-motif protein cell wall anchor domain protein, partial [Tissierellia bacterium KA00581]